jgi:hypothetical protein
MRVVKGFLRVTVQQLLLLLRQVIALAAFLRLHPLMMPDCCLIANLDAEGSGLFTSNGTTTTTIATRGINSFGSLGSPSINNAGIVAYECPFLATTSFAKATKEIA